MDRLLNIGAAGIVLLILTAIALNQVNDPFELRRIELEQRLSGISPVQEKEDSFLGEFDGWDEGPPPPPPPKKPDLAEMLGEVQATRQQVGDKVKFVVPSNPRGEFKGVGDTINGLTIKSITRTEVVFSYLWAEKDQELTYTMSRQ